MLIRCLCLAVALLWAQSLPGAAPAAAKSFTVGTLTIDDPTAPQTVRGATAGTIYLAIRNQGAETLQLVGVSSPAAAIVELRRAFRSGKLVKSRRMLTLNVEPGETLEINAGTGFEIALTGLAKRLEDGDTFPLTLEFDRIGKVEVTVEVKAPVYSDSPRTRGRSNQHLQ